MSVEAINQLRKLSNAFVQNLDVHIANVTEHNEKLLQLNKAQLKANKNAKGGPLVNNQTGSQFLSPAYAKRSGKSKPDIFIDGTTYREMDLLYNEPSQYIITSYSGVTKYLIDMYNDLFGIQDSKKAYSITVPELRDEWIKQVLNK